MSLVPELYVFQKINEKSMISQEIHYFRAENFRKSKKQECTVIKNYLKKSIFLTELKKSVSSRRKKKSKAASRFHDSGFGNHWFSWFPRNLMVSGQLFESESWISWYAVGFPESRFNIRLGQPWPLEWCYLCFKMSNSVLGSINSRFSIDIESFRLGCPRLIPTLLQ